MFSAVRIIPRDAERQSDRVLEGDKPVARPQVAGTQRFDATYFGGDVVGAEVEMSADLGRAVLLAELLDEQLHRAGVAVHEPVELR